MAYPQGMGAPQGQPWLPQPQPQPQPPPQPPPSNGLAMTALILGIITIGLSPLPILNQAGILVGLVGVALAVPALIIGARRGVRGAMATIGLVLSIVGLVSAFAFTNYYVGEIDRAFAPLTQQPNISESGGIGPTASQAPGPQTFTFRLSGTATRATVTYSLDGSSAGGVEVTVPWSTEMTTTNTGFNSASLSAHTDMGSTGNLTCTILDQTGAVLAQQTAESQGGRYGSASVNCFGS
jgi:hypothetical protein